MAQQYFVQSLDDGKTMYSGVQVLQLSGEDIGVSTLGRPQHLVLHEDQIVFNEGDQVVYQSAPANSTQQYQQQQQQQQQQPTQPPQQQQQSVATTHYIINDDLTQHQQQQQQQLVAQQPQVVYQQAAAIDHHRQQQQQQQLQPQQQQQQQHHYQTQEQYQQQQHQQETQQVQIQTQQHIQQQQPQQQTQQIYYTSDQVLQPGTIVHHTPLSAAQLQHQKQHQQQQYTQQQQTYQTTQQQIVHQQHAGVALQQTSTQQQQHPHVPQQQQQQQQQQPQQQQTIQLQTTPPQQPSQQHQVVYRMASSTPPQQQATTQMNVINNTHVIVQPSGQQVLIHSPPHQEIIMRQTMSPHRIIYNNRLVYATPAPQQQHQTIMQQQQQQHIHPQQQQQQQIQLQQNQMQHQQTPHLVQTRVATTQQQQPPQQQQAQQQAQTNVVFHQLQTLQPNKQNQMVIQTQQQQQAQQQQQQLVTTSGQQIVRGSSLRGRSAQGRIAATATGLTRPQSLATARQVMMAGGSIVRQVRPRGGATNLIGGVARGGIRQASIRAQRPIGSTSVLVSNRNQMLTTAAAGASIDGQTVQVVQHAIATQQQQHKQYTVTNLNQQQQQQQQPQLRSVYRTQVVESGSPQQQQQQQQILRTTQVKYRTAVAATTTTTPPVAGSTVAIATSTVAGNNIDMDIEESIQASMVKKDHQQKPMTTNGPIQLAGNTTLTSYYNTETGIVNSNTEADDQHVVRTPSGSSMTLSEFKKRNTLGSGSASPPSNMVTTVAGNMRHLGIMRVTNKLPVIGQASNVISTVAANQVANAQTTTTLPLSRILPRQSIGSVASPCILAQRQTTTTAAATTTATTTILPSSVQQTSHNNYEIHSQHVLNNRTGPQTAERDRNSAKMLVILASGEQRLITFTLPRESCTVQDLLEQVSVPFDNSTTIQCVENRGANVDFVVTVGFSVNESASELILRAEESLQLSRQQEQTATTCGNGGNLSSAITGPVAPGTIATGSAVTVATATSNGGTIVLNAARQAVAAATAPSNGGTSSVIAGNATSVASAIEEIPRKIIPGFLAVCIFCGFTGLDHAKCERCKRIFQDPPKRLPCVKSATVASTSSTDSTANSRPLTAEDQKKAVRKMSVTYNTGTQRGRGGSTGVTQRGGRQRGGRRAAEAEPVTLELSSDEEGDDNSNLEATNTVAVNSTNSQSSIVISPYKALSFEPVLLEKDESSIYVDFIREDVTDLTNISDPICTKVICKVVRIGGFRFEVDEPVIFTSRGVRIVAPLYTDPQHKRCLDIHKREVVKIIAHFSTKPNATSMITLYMLKTCAQYIKDTLQMTDESVGQSDDFTSGGAFQMRKIICEFENLPDQERIAIKSVWDFLDEISASDADNLLQRASEKDRQIEDNKPRVLQTTENVQLLLYPPGTGGISIRTDDYLCLAKEQYLNDIIIDFYLKWVHNNIIPEEQRERTFIFSTFFYKRLTTLTRSADAKQTAAQKRHARVQKWTKNLNIFDKDFIIIPINEQSHWFLAIICFPWLKGPVTFDTNTPVEPQQLKRQKPSKKVTVQIGNTTITPLSRRENNAALIPEICRLPDEDSERDEAEGDESDLASEDSENSNPASSPPTTTSTSGAAASASVTSPAAAAAPPVSTSTTATVSPTASVPTIVKELNNSNNNNNCTSGAASKPTPTTSTSPTTTVESIKQPLVLIFDSLAGASRSRVVATLRDYLTCEYRIKKPDAALHVFNKDNMPGHCVKVPQQNNFTDCGLYLLQYVEQFFKDPIRDFRLPIKQLSNWFDTLTVTKKREDISILLQSLMDKNCGTGPKIILPTIPFPTQNGLLIECSEDADNEHAEFEEEEGEEEPADEDEQSANTSEMMEVDQSSEDQNKSASSFQATKLSTSASSLLNSSTATTTSSSSATIKRKIVLKHRQPLATACSATSTGSPSITGGVVGSNGETATNTTTQLLAQGASGGVRPGIALKIRKIE